MIEVKVISKHSEALDICSIELASADGSALPPFTAGAHIDLYLKNGVTRQYSLCNSPDEQHRYQIAVLKDPNSRGGSLYVHEQLSVGDSLKISEPRNLFPLNENARRSLLFAGGIGITPLLCMAEKLTALDADFTLHYCSRSADRTAFSERIWGSAFAAQVQTHFDSGDDDQKLKADLLLQNPDPETHLYVCGPNGFMDFILGVARVQGWQEENLHREYFSAAPVDHSADASFSVQINSTGVIYPIPADTSVLTVLLEKGFDIPVSCEQGICGSCLTRVVAGTPDHRDMFMTEEEHELNDQFTPCCSRSKSNLLVLDL
jgi:vanillate O-demethylase ferredoxin subunit